MKKCIACGVEKLEVDFWKNPSAKGGLCNQCKKCKGSQNQKWQNANHDRVLEGARRRHARPENRDKKFKARLELYYGMTWEEYQARLVKCGGVCEICKKQDRDGYKLSVDHAHDTGKVRGLLCRQCNVALGNLQDSIGNCLEAAAYLCRTKENV